MMATRHCRTCRFAKWTLTKTGRIAKNEYGRCEYHVASVPLPFCHKVSHTRTAIWPADGEDCPCWEEAL